MSALEEEGQRLERMGPHNQLQEHWRILADTDWFDLTDFAQS